MDYIVLAQINGNELITLKKIAAPTELDACELVSPLLPKGSSYKLYAMPASLFTMLKFRNAAQYKTATIIKTNGLEMLKDIEFKKSK